MKVISLGMGQKIFEENSAVRQRMIQYGKIFDELHLIVFTPYDSRFQNQKLSNNVFLYPTNSKNRIFYIFDYLRIAKKIISKLKKENIVISCQDPFETGLVGFWLKIRYRLPLQVQLHTDFLNKYFITHNLLNFIRFPLGILVLSFADSVRTVSSRVAKSISSLNNNVVILPIQTKNESGIRNQEFWGESEKSKINILTVCRLEKEKNLETAIKAFKIVSEKIPDAVFTIVGDGSRRKSLEKLSISLNLACPDDPFGRESGIRFVGWQNNPESFYQNADVYISTSLYEGYGMSVVEAAHFELPLVLSDAGIAGEIFKDGESAFVCKPKDVNDFAQKVIRLGLDNNLRIRMGLEAKNAAKKQEINFPEYLNRYKDSVKQAVFSERNTNLFKRNMFLRYFVCGVSAATTNILVLYFFTDLLLIWYLYSSTVAFFVSLILSFTLQKFVVFRDRETQKIHYQFYKFFVVAVLGVFTNTILIYIFTDIINIWYILSQLIAGFFVMIQNFLMYKFFIFKKIK